MKKKFLAVVLCFALLCAVLPQFALPASAATYSGTCGENGANVKWTLNTSTGLLTVSGTGRMKDYTEAFFYHGSEENSEQFAPWISYRNAIKTITVEKGVTHIGDAVFSGCENLQSVTLSETVTDIKVTSVFSGCTAMTKITVSASNKVFMSSGGMLIRKNLGELVYCPRGKTGAVTVPDTVTSIGQNAFTSCAGMTSVTIPKSVTSIGYAAFYDCDGLTSVTIPNSVTSIGYAAFSECSGLKSITIPNSVTSIGEAAFRYCKSLESIVIPEGVKEIEPYVFFQCTSMKGILLPATLKRIKACAFVDCTALTGVYYAGTERDWQAVTVEDSGNQEMEAVSVHYNYKYKIASGKCGDNLKWTYDPLIKRLTITGSGNMYNYNNYNNFAPWKKYGAECTEIVLPYTMTRVSVCAFNGFSKVPSITIPKNCTYIDDFAFLNCSSMVKASFVTATHIGHNALANCTSLKNVYVYIKNCEIVDTAKTGRTLGVPGYTVIHGKRGSTAETYAKTYGYTFADIDTGKVLFGKCGDKLKWTYDSATKKLTITGSGDMYDYNNYNNFAPWKEYGAECREIELPYTMTRVSVCAFNGFSKVPSITIPKNCTYIDDFAFLNCSSMVKASFVTATHIGHNALANCTKLKDVYVYVKNCEIVDTARTGRTLGVAGYTVIHGYKGSTAETYARTYGYTFVPMT